MLKPAAFLGSLVHIAVLLVGGCGDRRTIDPSDCETADPSPTCPQSETCPGQCVPIPPVNWTDPLLLWTGDALLAPECPADQAGQIVYEGHAGLVDPPTCQDCTCEPAAGECGLPSVLTASSEFCGQSGMEVDFSGLDADPAVCNTENSIPAGNDPKSVTLGPLTLMESGCKPSNPLPAPRKNGSASARTFARACRGVAFPPCLDPSFLCVPTAEPPPEGFSQCIYRLGDHECPADYPDKRVFFDKVTDTRSCSPCSCGEPTGSACSAKVLFFQDMDCTQPAGGVDGTSLGPECDLLWPGPPLLGKKVTDITYYPGSCPASGGEPVGSADLMHPSTFCCQL